MSDVSGKINNLWRRNANLQNILSIGIKRYQLKGKILWILSDAPSGRHCSLERTHFFIVASVLYLMLLFELLWNWAAKTKASRWLNGSNFRKIGDLKVEFRNMKKSKKLTRKTLWRGSFEIQSQCRYRLTVEEKRESTLNCRMICVNGT